MKNNTMQNGTNVYVVLFNVDDSTTVLAVCLSLEAAQVVVADHAKDFDFERYCEKPCYEVAEFKVGEWPTYFNGNLRPTAWFDHAGRRDRTGTPGIKTVEL
jgi:hypothetical protein